MVTHTKNISEGIGFADSGREPAHYARTPSSNLVSVTDTRVRLIAKDLSSEIPLTDARVRTFTKNVSESFTIKDTKRRNANAVMFDLVLRNDALTAENFKQQADSPPLGYTPFQNFYPGDYEYREAMVGIRIRARDMENQAGIVGLTMNIDVPDVSDRGSAEILTGEEAGKTVAFAKTFKVPPEVNLAFATGTVAAIPELTAVTTSGFTFILRDINTPATLVTGEVTWAALGR